MTYIISYHYKCRVFVLYRYVFNPVYRRASLQRFIAIEQQLWNK